jgi:hypothetical protein
MVDTFLPSLPYTCRGVYFKPFYLKFKDVLLNFDDSLVQKVVRYKCKHIDGQTFKTENVESRDSVAAIPKILDEIKCKPTIPLVVSDDDKTKEAVFYVRKTSNTDIYELYRTMSDTKVHSIALVNSMAVSKMMKELFRDHNSAEKIPMKCVFNEKFQKYTPCGLHLKL